MPRIRCIPDLAHRTKTTLGYGVHRGDEYLGYIGRPKAGRFFAYSAKYRPGPGYGGRTGPYTTRQAALDAIVAQFD